ncbi:hypothetical protein RCL1_004099 [Eukaryota sp. TZLM3-RCL]
MSSVSVVSVKLLNNPAAFLDSYVFEIVFEADASVTPDDVLEFRFVYVGSSKSEEFDQELDTIEVSPIPLGISKFSIETSAPDPQKIPLDDLLGVTVIFVSCLLNNREVVRVGFFCHVEYIDPENEPDEPNFSLLRRNVNVEEPRITAVGPDQSNMTPPTEAIQS